MIRFVFGRPGSGKSDRMIEELRAHIESGGRRVWLIVPEQQVYSAERDILSVLPADAGRCFSIISFSRLCDAVADRFGGRTQHAISRSMRHLLMWQNLRELNGTLETYRTSAATDPSLCRRMLSVVEELKLGAISSARLESAAARLDRSAPLYGKLRDLALVSAAYDGLVNEVYGENPADRLMRAAEQIEAHDFFAGQVVYIDSFTSFTMQEYAVLRPLLRQAAEVTVSFDCAGRDAGEPHLESMQEAVRRLTRICEDAGRTWEDQILESRDKTPVNTELAILERSLWAFDLRAEERMIPAEEARGQIRLVTATTPYDEAQAAALHLLELHRSGISYGECAVVVRDAAGWRGILDAALEEHHIPFFLSERTDLSEKPAARLLLCALRCVARRWQAEDIIALGKTGLCGVTPRELDYFAEYVDTWHLSGRRMTESLWSMNPDGYVVELTPRAGQILLAANRVRETLMEPLLALERELRAAKRVVDECRALYDYLVTLGVREQLAAQAESFLSGGQAREAGEQVRLWSFLTETLATMASVMETAAPMNADELGTALSLVFAETDIGSVPARHDCVTVGSASTLRVDNIRAMLVLGLCEGEFPQKLADDGLFTEQDKETLATLGVELDSRTGRRMAEELLYVWRAFAKPSETLILSHSMTSPDGREARSPSAALARVKYLFPYLEPTAFSSRWVTDGAEDMRHRSPMEDRVARPTVRRLLGEEIWLSQSQLRAYAQCPYSYYGSYLLKLRERAEAKLDHLDAGLFLHHVLEEYLRRALDEANRLRPMEPDEVRELTDAIIASYIEEVCGDVARSGRLLHLFDRLRQVALVLIDSIQAELSASAFCVAGLEWDTHGRKPGDPRPMVLKLEPMNMESLLDANYPADATPLASDGFDDGLPTVTPVQNRTPEGIHGLPILTPPEESPVRLLLGGRIDRVDLWRSDDGETVYLRVVDYKSSKHDLTVKSVTENMNVQLLLYLFTLCSPENRVLFADAEGRVPKAVRPASAVYVSPDEHDREGAITVKRTGVVLNEEAVLQAITPTMDAQYLPSARYDRSGTLTGRGLCTAEQILELQEVMVNTIRETAATMYSGCADRTPSHDACRYCRMKDACSASVEG